jgi:hypothetical protein
MAFGWEGVNEIKIFLSFYLVALFWVVHIIFQFLTIRVEYFETARIKSYYFNTGEKDKKRSDDFGATHKDNRISLILAHPIEFLDN